MLSIASSVGYFAVALLPSSHREKFIAAKGTYNVTKAPFNNVAASNVAFMMSDKSSKMSCAATTNCEAGYNVLYCHFIESLKTGDSTFP